jgi:hypothetical protein
MGFTCNGMLLLGNFLLWNLFKINQGILSFWV